MLYARSHVVLAARLAGVPAIDQVVAAVRDTEAFRVDAEQARDLGYHGKICLHPLQVPIAHAVFTPSEEELAHARAVLAAAAGGRRSGGRADGGRRAHRDGARRAGAGGGAVVRTGLMIPPHVPLDRVLPRARRAEELGYDVVACGEHVFFHAPTTNALVALAGIAGVTSRVRLLSAVTVLPVYPGALAAKMVATLDGISGGRFELGVGVGGEFPAELAACGVDPAERGPRTDEALEIMTRLFAGEEVRFAGRFARLDGLRLDPLPVQRPGPPVWVGGRRPASLRRAARFADVWLPYMVDPERFAAGLAEVRAQATALGRPAPAGAAVLLGQRRRRRAPRPAATPSTTLARHLPPGLHPARRPLRPRGHPGRPSPRGCVSSPKQASRPCCSRPPAPTTGSTRPSRRSPARSPRRLREVPC